MLVAMETLGSRIITRCGVLVLALLAGSATSQSAPSSSTSPTSAPQVSTAQTPLVTPEQKPSDRNTPAGDDTVATIRSTTNEVNVVFTVTDKHGRYITDLKQNDFHVIDDNKPPEEVRSFHAETNLPLQVGLLIDASNSVRDRFKFEQESAVEFLNQTVRRRYDKAFVIGFDATPEVTQDFTDNTEALARGVHDLRPGGGTALYDALYYACRERLLKSPQNTPSRRAII